MIDTVFKKYEMVYRDWTAVVQNLESILEPRVFREFQKIYYQFNSYKNKELLVRMYDFIFSQNIQYHVNCHRVNRLKKIWETILPFIQDHKLVLDIGAGTGIISEAIRESFRLEIHHITDYSPVCMEHLKEIGFESYSEYLKYDVLLMVDALGEINIDEDNDIIDSLETSEMITGEILEERYGFVKQLGQWKNAMTPSSVILFFEPFTDRRIFEQLEFYLNANGWKAEKITCKSDSRISGLVLRLG